MMWVCGCVCVCGCYKIIEYVTKVCLITVIQSSALKCLNYSNFGFASPGTQSLFHLAKDKRAILASHTSATSSWFQHLD